MQFLLNKLFALTFVFPSSRWMALFVMLLVIGLANRWCSRLARGVRRALDHAARRPWLAVATCAAVAFTLAMMLSAVRWPTPRIHDEFSVLLQADTFASGRLTNPPHPLWEFFEAAHVIHQPTYGSKYPPGASLLLAAGWVLGSPVFGLWAGAALAAGCVCWALQGWLRPRWALLGGLLTATHSLTLYWTQTFLAGSLPLAAGALLIGGVFRAVVRPSIGAGLAIGLGTAVLSITRPSEGLVIVLLAIAAVAAGLLAGPAGSRAVAAVRSRRAQVRLLFSPSTVAPAVCVVATAFGFIALYNARVTGSPLLLPYMHHARTYAVAPNFVWQAAMPTPTYRHREIQELHAGWELEKYKKNLTLRGYLKEAKAKIEWLVGFVVVPDVLAVGLLMAVLAVRVDPRVRFATVVLGAFLVVVTFSQVFTNTHYVAPAGVLFIGLVTAGLRRLRAWRRTTGVGGVGLGRAVVRGIVALHVIAAINWFGYTYYERSWHHRRAVIATELESSPGRHLVVVRYSPSHDALEDWVANGADLEGAKVLWARDMGEARNRTLLAHYADRRIWLLEPDVFPPSPQPYPSVRPVAPTPSEPVPEPKYVGGSATRPTMLPGTPLGAVGPTGRP